MHCPADGFTPFYWSTPGGRNEPIKCNNVPAKTRKKQNTGKKCKYYKVSNSCLYEKENALGTFFSASLIDTLRSGDK